MLGGSQRHARKVGDLDQLLKLYANADQVDVSYDVESIFTYLWRKQRQVAVEMKANHKRKRNVYRLSFCDVFKRQTLVKPTKAFLMTS